jgi:hypothetical protein
MDETDETDETDEIYAIYAIYVNNLIIGGRGWVKTGSRYWRR